MTWKNRPGRSRSSSPSGRKRPNILDSLKMIDNFCDEYHLDEESEFILKHNVNPDEAIKAILCGRTTSQMKKSTSPSEVIKQRLQRQILTKDDGRIIPQNEHKLGTAGNLSFLEVEEKKKT